MTSSPTNTPGSATVRRNDLDAVRSFAMLLGILLHAALAYTGGWWLVTDDPSGLLGVTVMGIHGFRMPLFFMLSGFFAAMLWRKRGLGGLMKHRAKRILIPLLVGCATIVPAMSWVGGWAVARQSAINTGLAQDGAAREPAPSDDIWTAAAYGDLDKLRAYNADSDQLNTPDPSFGVTPLGWTALKNQPEATAYLLEIGADPSGRYRDQNTPMHTACFFGRDEVARLLIGAGADLTLVSATGERPLDALNHNQQTTEFIANMVQTPVVYEDVVEARERIREFAEAGAPEASESEGGHAALTQALHVNFFHHLWFLWFLCLLIVGFAIATLVLRVLPSVRVPGWLVTLPGCLLWLTPLSMGAQWFMHAQGPSFGPDTSTGIIPQAHVLSYYAIFFGFGALVYAVRGSGERIGPPRSWAITLPVGISLLFLGMTLEFSEGAGRFIGNAVVLALVSDLTQVLYAWLMTFGLISLFEALLSRERGWVRYLSDSSYWLYLAHLPLIIAGQALMLGVELGPLVKTSVLTIGITLGLLIVYQLGVRYTPIGTMLNGKRQRPTRVNAAASTLPAP